MTCGRWLVQILKDVGFRQRRWGMLQIGLISDLVNADFVLLLESLCSRQLCATAIDTILCRHIGLFRLPNAIRSECIGCFRGVLLNWGYLRN